MISLYIHIPFCKRKCDYCSFYSVTKPLYTEYTSALLRAFKELGKGQDTATVYLGGGTPSTLPKESLLQIMQGVKENFTLQKNAEITLECNPESVSADFLEAAEKSGVNRLSLGVQSFDDNELSAVARLHDSKGAKRALELCSQMFENISCDLIFGLPGQTEKSLEKSLETALFYGVKHISCYNLQIEEGTPIFERGTAVPDEQKQEKMYYLICELLKANGYEHYEISNFAKKGFESRHNSAYWTGDDYLGIGPSAHSKLGSLRAGFDADICKFMQKNEFGFDFSERITDPVFEKIMLGLRTASGIPQSMLKNSADYVQRLVGAGFARVENGNLSLTDRGFYLSNTIISDITAKEC